MSNDLSLIKMLSHELSCEIEIRRINASIEQILSDAITPETGSKQDILLPEYQVRMPFQTVSEYDKALPKKNLAVTDEIGNVIRLYISHVKAASIPKSVFELRNLELLCLYDWMLKDIPEELSKLENLKIVFLEKNQISIIEKNLIYNPSLIDLNIGRNPIKNIPEEIVKQGLLSIRNYLESIESATETAFLYEAKLVFVGRGFAGKTSLVKKLTDPKYKLEKNIKSTEGIDIKYWDLNISLEKSNAFRFNIWDFGGQEKYDATHQFFITERTLYIFVTEARQESNFLDFDYWLNVVQLLGNESPVIVVQNKIDLRKKNLPTEKYKKQFPNIVTFVDVSCSEGFENSIKNLVSEIKSAVKTLPQVGDALPKEWVDIRKELNKKRRDFISYEEYVRLCIKNGLSQEKADFLSRYYHDLGVIVHYSKDPLLKNMVIINPDWAVDGAYNVLDTKSVEENKGRFDNTDLQEIWGEPKYNKKHAELLALMKNYEICFELGNTGSYIAPELLPANPVKYKPIIKQGRLSFIYQ